MYAKDEIKEAIIFTCTYCKGSNLQLFLDNNSEVLICSYQNTEGVNDVLELCAHPEKIYKTKTTRIFTDMHLDSFQLSLRKESIARAFTRDLEIVLNTIAKEYPREKPYNHFYSYDTQLDEFMNDVYDYMVLEAI